MAWQFDGDRPIYSQLVEHIQYQIISGGYPPGEKLPSVRELAMEASVNPNTMQKALSELETDGLIFTQRTAGRFVTEDVEAIRQTRERLSRDIVCSFINSMSHLGCSPQQALAILTKYVEGLN